MYRGRFSLAYAGLALVLAGSAYGGYRGVQAPGHPHASRASCTAPQIGADPIATAAFFIHTAVERTNPAEGYALATPALRGTSTCDEWAHGKVPVPAFPKVDWGRTAYRVETQGTGQIVMQVMLASQALAKRSLFMLELRQVGTQWRVGYWGPSDVAA